MDENKICRRPTDWKEVIYRIYTLFSFQFLIRELQDLFLDLLFYLRPLPPSNQEEEIVTLASGVCDLPQPLLTGGGVLRGMESCVTTHSIC